MRRRLFLLGGVVTSMAIARPAHAIFGILDCQGPCAELWEQLVQIYDQVQSYVTQVAQYWNEVQTALNTTWEIVSLPMNIVSGVMSDVTMIKSLANGISILTGNTGSIISRLQAAAGYANVAAMTPTMITGQINAWANSIGKASSDMGKVMDQLGLNDLLDAAKQDSAEALSAAAQGTKSAVQAGNQIMAVMSKSMIQMNENLVAYIKLETTKALNDADRDAMGDASQGQFLLHSDFNWSNPWHF